MAQPGVLVPAPQAHDFKAVMHRGYATQWFGLALVLSIGYIVYGLRRHD
jgi:cytochrome oxidase assembly protein ShyY1